MGVKSNENICCKYLMPPCANFELFDDAPDPKSYFSIISVFNPLEAASRATPAPTLPPPITNKS